MLKRIRYCDECRCEREAVVKERNSTYTYRNEQFEIIEEYAECTECGNAVTDEELDNKTLKQVSDLYQIKHSVNPEMLKEIRKGYDLSQYLFAKLLNMGIATIKRYELGTSSPDTTQIGIYKLLKSNPKSIMQFFEQNKSNFEPDELKTVEKKLESFIDNDDIEDSSQRLLEKTYEPHNNTIETGGITFNYQKLFHMILFFSREHVLKTKLMKLLWYSDFLRYKRTQKPISGTPYWHLPYGPVPKKHDFVLGTMVGLDLISIREEENPEGYTMILIQAKKDFDPNIFDHADWDVLRYVEDYFKTYGSRRISDFAHEEEAWKQTRDEQIISYEYAESLRLN